MSTPIQASEDFHVADQAAHDAKPCCGFRGLASAHGTLSLDRSVACHSALHSEDNLSSRTAVGGDGGGHNLQSGSQGVVTQYNSDAENIIQFPSGRSFLPDYQGSGPGLSLQDEQETGVACVLAVFAGFLGAAIGLGIYFGSLLFSFFDFG